MFFYPLSFIFFFDVSKFIWFVLLSCRVKIDIIGNLSHYFLPPSTKSVVVCFHLISKYLLNTFQNKEIWGNWNMRTAEHERDFSWYRKNEYGINRLSRGPGGRGNALQKKEHRLGARHMTAIHVLNVGSSVKWRSILLIWVLC